MATPGPVTLGVDPSLSASGWCILGGTLLAHGVIRTKKTDGTDSERNAAIVCALLEAVKSCPEPIGLIAIETQFAGGGGDGFRARAGAAMRVAAVRGAVGMLGPMLSVPVVEVSPAEAKRALTGSGKATKRQMQAAVLRDYGEKLATDAADSVGIALAARQVAAGRTPPPKKRGRATRPESTAGLPVHVQEAIERGAKK